MTFPKTEYFLEDVLMTLDTPTLQSLKAFAEAYDTSPYYTTPDRELGDLGTQSHTDTVNLKRLFIAIIADILRVRESKTFVVKYPL